MKFGSTKKSKEKSKEKKVEEVLLNQYEKYYRLAFSYVHNQQDALDVVQESACKAITNADSLKEDKFIDTWICRIVINESKNHLQKAKKMVAEDISELDYNASLQYHDTYEDVDLAKAMDQLTMEEQEVIKLYYYEQLTLQEIALVLQENISTVKSRLYRTLKKLEVKLEG